MSVLTTTADIIRSGYPIAGTMKSQNGSPNATISQAMWLITGSKRGGDSKSIRRVRVHPCPPTLINLQLF
jgi:hypothetical protein